jgi:hypothetical protein
LGAGGGILEVAGVGVAVLGRVVVALLGGMTEPAELLEREFDSVGAVTVVEPAEAGGGVSVSEGGPVGGASDAGGASLAGGVAMED